MQGCNYWSRINSDLKVETQEDAAPRYLVYLDEKPSPSSPSPSSSSSSLTSSLSSMSLSYSYLSSSLSHLNHRAQVQLLSFDFLSITSARVCKADGSLLRILRILTSHSAHTFSHPLILLAVVKGIRSLWEKTDLKLFPDTFSTGLFSLFIHSFISFKKE